LILEGHGLFGFPIFNFQFECLLFVIVLILFLKYQQNNMKLQRK